MKHFSSKPWIVTACLLTLWACQAVPKVTHLPATPVTAEAARPSGVPATAEAIQTNMEFGPGAFRLQDPTVDLADLSSYKATLQLSFDGTQADQASQWSHTYVMLASRDPATRQLTIESVGGDPARVFLAEANGVSYERKGQNDCTASTAGAGSPLATRWEPAGFLHAIIGAEAAGDETVNGVATHQYVFDERALGEAGFSKSLGQVWVAAEKGYVVRLRLTTTAGADYFGEAIEGTLTWEYNLTEINQPVFVELPEGCPGGLVDLPLMPNAQSIRRVPGATIYVTTGSIQDVLTYYQEQLPAQGWIATGNPVVSPNTGLADFTKEDQQLSVIVTPSEDTVTVRLVVGAVPDPAAIPVPTLP